MNLGCELKTLFVVNSSGLWLTCMTPGRELKDLDVLNSLGSKIT